MRVPTARPSWRRPAARATRRRRAWPRSPPVAREAESELAQILGEQERAAAHGIALATASERLSSRREALAQRLGEITAEAARERERADRLAAEAAALSLQAEAAVEAAERMSAAEAALAPVDEGELASASARAAESGEAALAARRAAAELTGAAAHAEAALAAQRVRAARGAERRDELLGAVRATRAELAGGTSLRWPVRSRRRWPLAQPTRRRSSAEGERPGGRRGAARPRAGG